ncbi:MAG: isoprenoid biosynthesis glyoxalase ElbB [Bdellovibrionaceae bacterium]|jgi:enhancing lycopene biosynthesis protein 2|nr:isoprenoid biosynthesis glyoxalase ElbB [Pseudobdellovibrionaceae bacterium]
MRNFAVILSGCGFKDGTEITEAVSTLIALKKMGANYEVFSLDKIVASTNHLSDETLGEQNLLEASARITRGKIKRLEELNSEPFDAIIFPGGFGAALHLCDFAKKGAACSVDPVVEKIVNLFYEESKPIGAFCIAPALIAKILGKHNPVLTIGNDEATAKEIEKTGASHVVCEVTDYTTDRESKLVTTPAYMYDEADAFEVYTGIERAVKELVEMA